MIGKWYQHLFWDTGKVLTILTFTKWWVSHVQFRKKLTLFQPIKFAEIDNEFLKKLHSHGWLGISSNVHALISFAHLFLQVIITANLMFWNPTTTMHCGACGVESAAKDLKLNVKCCKYVTISKTYNLIFGLAWANEWDTCGAPSINMMKNNLNLNRNHIEESRYELEKTNDPYVFTTGIFYINSR